MRREPWNLQLKTVSPASGQREPEARNPPLLFNLMVEPSERTNVAEQHPEVIQQKLKDVDAHRQSGKPRHPMPLITVRRP